MDGIIDSLMDHAGDGIGYSSCYYYTPHRFIVLHPGSPQPPRGGRPIDRDDAQQSTGRGLVPAPRFLNGIVRISQDCYPDLRHRHQVAVIAHRLHGVAFDRAEVIEERGNALLAHLHPLWYGEFTFDGGRRFIQGLPRLHIIDRCVKHAFFYVR